MLLRQTKLLHKFTRLFDTKGNRNTTDAITFKYIIYCENSPK